MARRRARIGLVSDTHGLVRPEVLAALEGCERIVHAGGDALWDQNNQGKLYKHLEGTVIGGPKDDEDDDDD